MLASVAIACSLPRLNFLLFTICKALPGVVEFKVFCFLIDTWLVGRYVAPDVCTVSRVWISEFICCFIHYSFLVNSIHP